MVHSMCYVNLPKERSAPPPPPLLVNSARPPPLLVNSANDILMFSENSCVWNLKSIPRIFRGIRKPIRSTPAYRNNKQSINGIQLVLCHSHQRVTCGLGTILTPPILTQMKGGKKGNPQVNMLWISNFHIVTPTGGICSTFTNRQ